MSAEPSSTETPDQDLTAAVEKRIFDELRYLRSLFERRLMEDKVKERAFNDLCDQLDFAKQGLVNQFLLPLVSDIILICDRLERAAAQEEYLFSVVDEMLEVFFRRGLSEIEWEGGFDPRLHEMVKAIPVSNESQDHINIDLERRGFTFGDIVVRPARVLVGKYETGPLHFSSDSPDIQTSEKAQSAAQSRDAIDPHREGIGSD